MSLAHMIILGIILLIVVPPDKLPELTRQVARFIADLKRSTSGIWDDLKQDASLKPEDLLNLAKDKKEKSENPPKEGSS